MRRLCIPLQVWLSLTLVLPMVSACNAQGERLDVVREIPAGSDQTAKNDAVRAELMAHNDDGRTARQIRHYAYPKPAADIAQRASMIDQLKGRGFAVSNTATDQGLVLEHIQAVAGADFDKLTIELTDWFAARGWTYDGWESAVVKLNN